MTVFFTPIPCPQYAFSVLLLTGFHSRYVNEFPPLSRHVVSLCRRLSSGELTCISRTFRFEHFHQHGEKLCLSRFRLNRLQLTRGFVFLGRNEIVIGDKGEPHEVRPRIIGV